MFFHEEIVVFSRRGAREQGRKALVVFGGGFIAGFILHRRGAETQHLDYLQAGCMCMDLEELRLPAKVPGAQSLDWVWVP